MCLLISKAGSVYTLFSLNAVSSILVIFLQIGASPSVAQQSALPWVSLPFSLERHSFNEALPSQTIIINIC